jgi:hypothetical protein
VQKGSLILCSIVASSPMRIRGGKLEFEDGRPMRKEYRWETGTDRVEEILT